MFVRCSMALRVQKTFISGNPNLKRTLFHRVRFGMEGNVKISAQIYATVRFFEASRLDTKRNPDS
jgi:hypothetical protein